MSDLVYFLSDVSSYYSVGPTATYSMPFFNGGFMCGGGTQTHVIGNAQDVRQIREDDRASNAALIGGLAAIAFSAITAFTLKSYLANSAALEKAKNFRTFTLPNLTDAEQKTLTPILNRHIENVEANVTKSRNYSILAGAVLVSAIAGFIGGMAAAPWLITASIVSVVFTACIGAFYIAWTWSDDTKLPAPMLQKIQQIIHNNGLSDDFLNQNAV